MKILLDENIHLRIKEEFQKPHEVFTARELNWNGKKNGELLELCEKNNFDIMITLDKNLHYQQNLSKHSLKVILLRVKNNRYITIKEILPKVFIKLNEGLDSQLTIIE